MVNGEYSFGQGKQEGTDVSILITPHQGSSLEGQPIESQQYKHKKNMISNMLN